MDTKKPLHSRVLAGELEADPKPHGGHHDCPDRDRTCPGLHGGNAAPLAVELFRAREDGSGAEHHGQYDHGVRLGTADLPGMETA